MRGAIILVTTIVLLLIRLTATVIGQLPTKTQSPSPPTKSATPVEKSQPQKQEAQEVSEDDVIRVNTTLITSNALVIGRDRNYVPNLQREDFHIFEDGVEQKIAYFASVDRPFDVALIIDNSRSTIFDLRDIRDAAFAFINQMRRDDRAIVISLGDDFKTVVGPTNNHETLKQAINSIKPGGSTRLYDAVDFAINKVMVDAVGRRAIILLTDGVDNDSRDASYQSNLIDIVSSGVQVYAVQFSSSDLMFNQAARVRRPAPEGSGFSRIDYQRADAYLHQVAELTGTTVYPSPNLSNLDSAIAGIADELHNEYTLGYYPRVATGNRGEIRRLEVRIAQPWLAVRSRTSYSFGPSGISVSENKPVIAPLTRIESLSASHNLIEDRKPRNARWICKGPFVPGDYALVQEGYDEKCPASNRANDQTNAWFIRKPGPSEVVCKGYLFWKGSEVEITPIPSGYAVVGETKSPTCSQSNDPKHPANAWKIKRPTSEETVCKGFLIPNGFVAVNEKKETACPATSREANAWIIIPTPYIETRRIWTVPD